MTTSISIIAKVRLKECRKSHWKEFLKISQHFQSLEKDKRTLKQNT